MNKEVKEFEETTISAKSGIKIIKLVFLEDDFPAAHVIEREVQRVVKAGEKFCIRRKLGLPASA